MRKRLVAVLAVAAVWIPLGVLRATDSGEQLSDSAELAMSKGTHEEVLVAGRESLYRAQTNSLRIQNPIVSEQVRDDVHTNPDRIRVLVMGDSFTFGHGAYDMDVRWWKRLDEELVRRYGDGVFELVALAQDGSSVVTQAGWLKELQDVTAATIEESPDGAQATVKEFWSRTPEEYAAAVARLSAPFDAVLTGFVGNDVVIDSAGGFASDDAVVVSRDRNIEPVQYGQVPNPNAELVNSAIAYTAAQFPGIPKLLMPLETPTSKIPSVYTSFPPYKENGYIIVPNPAMEHVKDTVSLRERSINPVDEHPGPILTRAYAVDTADALARALGSKIARAQAGARPVVRPLVTAALPHQVAVSEKDGIWTAAYDGKPLTNCEEMVEGGMGVVRQIRCQPDGTQEFLVGGERVPEQYLPCTALGRPHAAVWLDRMLPAGTTIDVGLAEASVPELVAYTYGYSDTDRPVVSAGTVVKQGDLWSVTVSRSATAILLAPPGDASCSLDTPMSTFPKFTLNVRRAP